jgi:hypothetical protein
MPDPPNRDRSGSARILSALAAQPEATDSEIAATLGISRQRVTQVRGDQGEPRRGTVVGADRLTTVRLPSSEWTYLRPGETMSERIRRALQALRAGEDHNDSE